MANIISFNINNNRQLRMIQRQHDGKILCTTDDHTPIGAQSSDNIDFISAGDMVMMLNYYRYIKSNDIRHDFINPNGKNEEV